MKKTCILTPAVPANKLELLLGKVVVIVVWVAVSASLPAFAQRDPFPPVGDLFAPGSGDDPFGEPGGGPFGGDPFGGDDFYDGDPGAGFDDPGFTEHADYTSGRALIHTTIRFGPGTPALAVEPSAETGALVFDVPTPLGQIPILIQPAGPNLTLTPAPIPEARPLRPPSIFSAPLPTGSGARALGFAGTFTAIADDATAASWNPAGLIQLKRPEVSWVYRYSRFENEHRSEDPDVAVGENDYESHGLNYLTGAAPVQLPWTGDNAVFSINYQEVYDFEHVFTAVLRGSSQQHCARSAQATFEETQIDRFVFEPGGIRSDVAITSHITTRSSSSLQQVIDTAYTADVDFRQEGVIDAVSPAMAWELHPRFSLGCAVNLYRDNMMRSGGIQARTESRYTAVSTSRSTRINHRATSVSYDAIEVTTIPGGGVAGPDDIVLDSAPIQGAFPTVVQADTRHESDTRIVKGEHVEENRYEDLRGLNLTLGLWWVANDFATFGAAVDLPWNADSQQTRDVFTTTTTFDATQTRVLGQSSTREHEQQDVTFEFPLFATAGMFLLWSPNLYSAIDVEFSQWSDFAYNLGSQGRVNPFDGSAYGRHTVEDTWSVRVGTEYLLEFEDLKLHVPLRVGLAYEQRPAIGTPDDYYGFSLGTGFALGEDSGQWIFDIAYGYLRADQVQSAVPELPGLTSRTEQHQGFVSLVKHF